MEYGGDGGGFFVCLFGVEIVKTFRNFRKSVEKKNLEFQFFRSRKRV